MIFIMNIIIIIIGSGFRDHLQFAMLKTESKVFTNYLLYIVKSQK